MLWDSKLGARLCRALQGGCRERTNLYAGLEIAFIAAGSGKPRAALCGWDRVQAGEVEAVATDGH